jgi:hypothetical protein
MNTWLKQMNYPSVRISIKRDDSLNTSNAVFSQSRFLLTNTSDTTQSPYKQVAGLSQSPLFLSFYFWFCLKLQVGNILAVQSWRHLQQRHGRRAATS